MDDVQELAWEIRNLSDRLNQKIQEAQKQPNLDLNITLESDNIMIELIRVDYQEL